MVRHANLIKESAWQRASAQCAPSHRVTRTVRGAMTSLGKRLVVEGAGTAWLVFVGCGSIVLNGAAPQPAYGVLEVALAFGLALATATYALERLSGAHFNPIVTVGFAVANRFPIRDLVPYISAQILGAVA